MGKVAHQEDAALGLTSDISLSSTSVIQLRPTPPTATATVSSIPRSSEAGSALNDGQAVLRSPQIVSAQEVATVAKRDALAKRLGVTFKDAALLKEALVHSSYLNENPDLATRSNERLEFLGDAVLGLVVADELFAGHPDLDEGKLTELRTQLVRRDTLATAASRLELGKDLLLGRGEEGDGGRERPTNLSHVYESVVGAIFLDRGLAAAGKFVRHSLGEEFDKLTARDFPLDAKSRLQELTQSRSQTTPLYRLVRSEGPDHARRFVIEVLIEGKALGEGEGASKQQAEKKAAQEALDQIGDPFQEEQTGMSEACT